MTIPKKSVKKAVKKTPVSKYNAITLLVKKADNFQKIIDGKLMQKQDLYIQLAKAVLKGKKSTKTNTQINAELKRLVEHAKDIVKKDGYVIKHDKNMWSMVSNLVMLELAKDKIITAPAGKDSKGNNVIAKVKVSELPKTAKAVATNASLVREAIGASDKRKTNTPKTRAPQTPAGNPPAKHSTAINKGDWVTSMGFAFKSVKSGKSLMEGIVHHREQIQKLGLAMGYVISIEKKAK